MPVPHALQVVRSGRAWNVLAPHDTQSEPCGPFVVDEYPGGHSVQTRSAEAEQAETTVRPAAHAGVQGVHG